MQLSITKNGEDLKIMLNLKLSLKISFLLSIIIFFSIFAYLMIYIRHYQQYEIETVGQENIATLHSIDTSLITVFENADNYSKLILADSVVQDQMKSGNIVSDFNKQQVLISRIYSVMQFSESIDTVWLIDRNGQKLTVGEHADSYSENTTEYDWLKDKYGRVQLLTEKREGQNYSVLVRPFNDLNTFESRGVIGVQIDNQKIKSLISESVISEKDGIIILNENNDVIFKEGDLSPADSILQTASELETSDGELLRLENIDKKPFFLSGIINYEKGWKIIRYSPVIKTDSFQKILQFNIILIIALGILIIGISVTIANILTRPVQALLDRMKNVEHGELTKISERTYLSEFRVLFDGYNKMVDEIKRLIQEAVLRQKRIRIVEMNEMQELMKPHFLYNTLETLEALILTENMRDSAKLVEALGDFYRKSVSGGREFLSISEEIQIARDYADILKIRFGETFKFDVRLDEACAKYNIPKLTIQPLVENSFQHGIRQRKQYGYIQVCVEKIQDKIHICVRDNGKGIPKEVMDEISSCKTYSEKRSLGLRGTIQRLSLLYEDAFSYEILNSDMSEIHIYLESDVLGEYELWKN